MLVANYVGSGCRDEQLKSTPRTVQTPRTIPDGNGELTLLGIWGKKGDL